mmetsp:Transcript_13196/g.32940  ORF Transcript_13196/g.32940 Transcript_13196/m.32940 type:complete len:267 (-) Transcript_13196:624-1424(-)
MKKSASGTSSVMPSYRLLPSMRPTNSKRRRWCGSASSEVGEGQSCCFGVCTKRPRSGSKARAMVSSRNSLNTPVRSMPASARPVSLTNSMRMVPLSCSGRKPLSCTYPSSSRCARRILTRTPLTWSGRSSPGRLRRSCHTSSRKMLTRCSKPTTHGVLPSSARARGLLCASSDCSCPAESCGMSHAPGAQKARRASRSKRSVSRRTLASRSSLHPRAVAASALSQVRRKATRLQKAASSASSSGRKGWPSVKSSLSSSTGSSCVAP